MKNLIFVIVIFALSYLSHAFACDPASTHGMLIFGKDKIYVSHLPMFHSPHNYQMVSEVELDGDSRQKYLELRELHPDELMTIMPEPFVLPEMVIKPRPFLAKFFLGHFERGGVVKGTMTVKLKNILLFQKLPAEVSAPLVQRGFIFGEQNDQYMVHVISSRPDFDQLVNVKSKKNGFTVYPDGPVKEGSLYLEYDDLAN